MQENELRDLVVPELDALGFECVKLEVVGSGRSPVLRLFIDKPGGVKISDCSMVSRTVALLLEEADPFPGRYLLEVSSPGSDRPLVTGEHFQRFVNEPAVVRTRAANGDRITYTGTIRSCIDDVVTLGTDHGEIAVPLDSIISARLVQQEYRIDKKMNKEKRNKRRGDHK